MPRRSTSNLVDLDDAYDEFMMDKSKRKYSSNKQHHPFLVGGNAHGYHVSLAPSAVETSDSSSDSEASSEDFRASKSEKRVSFAGVSVREYELTVADSPVASSIYPIGLGWKHSETMTVGMKEFESRHSSSLKYPFTTTVRGFRKARRLNTADRFTRLANFSGLTAKELYDLELTRSVRNKREKAVDCKIAQKRYQRVDLDQYARIAV